MRIGCNTFTHLVVLLTVLSLCACASALSTPAPEEKTAQAPATPAPAEPPPASTVNSVQQAKPLDARFSDILVNDIKATDAIKDAYPAALADLETGLIAQLRSKNAYARVVHNAGAAPLENTLLVNLTITDIRIPSSGARFWGGPFAGSSYMSIDLELVDGLSGQSLRKETLSSSNSSMAATWNFGASDRSLPSDMGVIAAEYIYTVAPPNK